MADDVTFACGGPAPPQTYHTDGPSKWCPECGHLAVVEDDTDQISRGIGVDDNPCHAGWAGCDESYTGGHSCHREGGHKGRHRCVCGATKSGGAS